MKEIKPINNNEDDNYFSVEDPDGVLRCSCGRELRQLDEDTFVCPGGYPIYRFSNGTITIDKFGNLVIKKLDHTPK